MTSGLSENTACSACNRSAPSQAATPAIPSPVPSTPFELIVADFFGIGSCHYRVAGDRLSGWVEIFKAPHGTAQASAYGYSLRSVFLRKYPVTVAHNSYQQLSNQMGSPSSHVLRVFPSLKRSCRSGGQKGKAHANGQRWPHWVSEQRWPPVCINPGAQHAGPRLQCITSTGGIWQAHSRCFFLHQPMHQVQPIDTSHMARGRHASQDATLYRSPRYAYATICTYNVRRQSIPAKPTR